MEKLLIGFAYVLRKLPSFRGKYRIGIFLENLLIPNSRWKTRQIKVKLKKDHLIIIDPNSATHKAPLYCGTYDDNIIYRFSGLFQPGWIIFDIGASIGYWTIPFLKKIKELKSGSVFSFEPLPKNHEILKRNLQINGLHDIANILNYAVGNFVGTIPIHATEAGETGNAYIGEKVINDISHTFQSNVEILTLDSLSQKFERCDFIKMDIEGAEYFVIDGAQKFIDEFRPIIFGEFNSKFLDNFGYSIVDIANILKSKGYLAFFEGSEKFEIVEPKHKMEDILFVPKEKLNLVSSICDLKTD
jgi:FkbM family methyltransferase